MPDVDNVLVALTGSVLTAPLGTTAPTNPTAAWGTGWVDLGWISEDGVTESYSDDSNEIKAWQGGATVRTVITGSTATYQFTCIETNPEVIRAYHKGSTLNDEGTFASIDIVGGVPDIRSWGLDVVDGANHLRLYIARGEVTERGDITYNASDAIGYELTVTAYPDTNGVVATKFSDTPSWLSA